METTKQTTAWLRRRRNVLAQRLSGIKPALIRGSLVERYKRCGKEGCRCMKGIGHGPKYYLTRCLGKGKLDSIYVPLEQVGIVRTYARNFQKLQESIKELCDINRELLRRKEPF